MISNIVSIGTGIFFQYRYEPNIYAIDERLIIGYSLDFKTDTCLCPPDTVHFIKNHHELGWTPSTVTNMHVKRYSVDWNVGWRFIGRRGYESDGFFGLNRI